MLGLLLYAREVYVFAPSLWCGHVVAGFRPRLFDKAQPRAVRVRSLNERAKARDYTLKPQEAGVKGVYVTGLYACVQGGVSTRRRRVRCE
jgi:hypothetical protein